MATKVILEPYVYTLDPNAHLICGADEAGRGPLMGNVVAGCVLLDPNNPIDGLNDIAKIEMANLAVNRAYY